MEATGIREIIIAFVLIGVSSLILRFLSPKTKIKTREKPKDQLEIEIEKIINLNMGRDTIVNKLKKLLLPKGYRVTIEEAFIIQFKAKGLTTYNIDLEPYENNSTHSTKDNTFLLISESVIGMFTKIAKSDGIISREEADIIQASIDDFIDTVSSEHNYSQSELSTFRTQLIQVHNDAKSNSFSIGTYARKITHMDIDFKSRIVQQLIVIATIDGYTILKESLVYEAGTTLGLTRDQIQDHIDDIVGSKKNGFDNDTNFDAYKVLQCKKSDTNATIKKQYRILIKKYHPDFIQSKGLDEAFIEFAKQKLQEINKAYEIIKKERGL